jgi:predicted ribosome quality control (RQC) complex YloA/Tae2 family protein
MELQTLSAVIAEVSSLFLGARVDRVYESDVRDIIMIVRNAGRRFVLLISPDRSLPRVHMLSRKPTAGPSLRPFTLYLRSRITGGRLKKIGILNRDRIIEMLFESHGRILRLFIELFGSATNLIITDQEGIIQSVYYSTVSGSDRKRILMPGISYALPEQKVVAAVGFGEAYTEGRVHSSLPAGSPNLDAEVAFHAFLERRRFNTLKAKLLAAVQKALVRVERRIVALDSDLVLSDRADEFRHCGDLILANLQSIQTGMEEADLCCSDGGCVTVRLNPTRSPSENAELYYKRYKKAKAGQGVIRARSAEARATRTRIESILQQLKQASSEAELSLLQAEFDRSALIHTGPVKQPRAPAKVPDPYREIWFQGWEILVGRNARGNDHITSKIARGSDLWFHAEGLPGSHVLIRNPQSLEIPQAVIERAASLAAFYSRGKNAGKVAVSYAFSRAVRKPKGAKPGLVVLSERRTMIAVPRGEQNDER